MAWYYAKDGERFGPISEQNFQQLIGQGTVSADTLVWREGMDNWQPYGSVREQVSMGEPAPAAEAAESAAPMTICSSCGRTVPSDEVIQYQGSYICAACKPMFVQQLKEGGLVGAEMDYGGFWIRFLAVFLDGIILFIPGFLLNLGIEFLAAGMSGDSVNPVLALLIAILYLASIGIRVGYETFFIGRFGQTPGKMVCGVKVVRSDGSSLTYLRAFARYWAKMLSGMLCLMGYIIAGFDSEKRALHDHICDTRVIKV